MNDVVCPCGHHLDDEDNFCMQCGKPRKEIECGRATEEIGSQARTVPGGANMSARWRQRLEKSRIASAKPNVSSPFETEVQNVHSGVEHGPSTEERAASKNAKKTKQEHVEVSAASEQPPASENKGDKAHIGASGISLNDRVQTLPGKKLGGVAAERDRATVTSLHGSRFEEDSVQITWDATNNTTEIQKSSFFYWFEIIDEANEQLPQTVREGEEKCAASRSDWQDLQECDREHSQVEGEEAQKEISALKRERAEEELENMRKKPRQQRQQTQEAEEAEREAARARDAKHEETTHELMLELAKLEREKEELSRQSREKAQKAERDLAAAEAAREYQARLAACAERKRLETDAAAAAAERETEERLAAAEAERDLAAAEAAREYQAHLAACAARKRLETDAAAAAAEREKEERLAAAEAERRPRPSLRSVGALRGASVRSRSPCGMLSSAPSRAGSETSCSQSREAGVSQGSAAAAMVSQVIPCLHGFLWVKHNGAWVPCIMAQKKDEFISNWQAYLQGDAVYEDDDQWKSPNLEEAREFLKGRIALSEWARMGVATQGEVSGIALAWNIKVCKQVSHLSLALAIAIQRKEPHGDQQFRKLYQHALQSLPNVQ